ncbi:uncharacterized protein [Physcomitrium patens]|uniref:uncharacterized protein isoform X1 n=1 Tax=Physcomitrium patens TaxID=3218 RepID=UPI0001622E3B
MTQKQVHRCGDGVLMRSTGSEAATPGPGEATRDGSAITSSLTHHDDEEELTYLLLITSCGLPPDRFFFFNFFFIFYIGSAPHLHPCVAILGFHAAGDGVAIAGRCVLVIGFCASLWCSATACDVFHVSTVQGLERHRGFPCG